MADQVPSPTSINGIDNDLTSSLAESQEEMAPPEDPPSKEEPKGGFKYLLGAAKKLESLDILAPEANAFAGKSQSKRDQFMNWVNFFLLGVFTGALAFGIDELEELLVNLRWNISQTIMNEDLNATTTDHVVSSSRYLWAWFAYAGYSCVLVTSSAIMSLYWAPGAIGSGVAETLAYVNGVNYAGLIGWPTLIVKSVGVVFAVAGGIKVGKEGPLAHIGSVVGAIVLYLPWRFNKAFRNDRDKRIIVAAGAGVGVSVAFGAPIGGVLFAYEISKANSFWTFGIAWRTFFATSLANFVLTICEGLKAGNLSNVTNSGLIKFAEIKKNSYDLGDILIFVLIGILGGLLGSLYIFINGNLAKFRKYVLNKPYIKLLEAAFFGFAGATIVFFLPAAFESLCTAPPEGIDKSVTHRYRCPVDGEENPMATLFFSTEGDTVKFLLTAFKQGSDFNFFVSLTFFLVWFFFCAVEYGIAIPAGLFFPGLLIGASLGHFVALFLNKIDVLSEHNMIESMSVFAIIGGVSVLTGYT
jgi:H+/Cl- antiporter ClcA